VTATLVDPSTEQRLGSAVIGTAEDVDAAVSAAHDALPAWSALTFAERADVVDRFVDAWLARSEDVATSVSREMGMPIAMSRLTNGTGAAMTMRYYADLGRTLQAEDERTPMFFEGTSVVRRSLSVSCRDRALNYPLPLIATVVGLASWPPAPRLPPVENAFTPPGDAFARGRRTGRRPHVVPGDAGFGEVSWPTRVASVAFTGSTAVGRRIGAVVGARLGSCTRARRQSAAIVPTTLTSTPRSSSHPGVARSGQTCFAQTRIVATPGIHDDLVARLAAWAQEQVLGNAFDDAATMGPRAAARTTSVYVADGVASVPVAAEGWTPRCRAPASSRPPLFTDVDNSWPIARRSSAPWSA
jgi:acyl-CoA reductase-like NAD-dependent aldehyde dehydrogenase